MQHGEESSLLYLFIAAAIGSFVGNIKYKGNGLGIAAVLFVGLVIGAFNPTVQIPKIITVLGLSMFVYSVGLSSGPAFFGSFKTRGATNAWLAVITLSLLSLITALLHFVFSFSPGQSAGLLAGVTTNTPALAGLQDAILKSNLPGNDIMAQNAVVGYSISYPMGVLGTMIGLALVQRLFRPDYLAEAKALSKEYPLGQNIVNYTIKITQPAVTGIRLRDLKKQFKTNVIFGRTKQEDHLGLSHAETVFHLNDEVTLVGDEHEVERIRELFGEKAEEHLADDRSVLDIKRMFVSNKSIAGKTIRDLNLQDNFSAVITRVQRGDSDMLATPNTVLELGDRVRVVAERKDIKEVQTLFGDSYDSLSHIDLLSFGLGMGLGFLLGSMQMSIPIININFSLGAAGGPLVAGLVLSAIRRSGPVLWNIPYSANLMLRQVGLMLMLAAIGINSGHKFILTMQTSVGPLLFLSGAVISVLGTLLAATVAFKLLKIPMSLTLGMLSHHPALLDYAANSTGNKIPSFGYALVMPLLLIGKIIFAQLLWQLLQAMS